MPTAAKLVSLIMFAALAWFVSQLVMPLMPDGTEFGFFAEINAALAGYLGWRIVGPRAPDSFRAGLSAGLTCALMLFVTATLFHSFILMLVRSTEARYKGPIQALKSMFQMASDFAQPALTPEVVVPLVVGGLVAGFAASAVSRVYS